MKIAFLGTGLMGTELALHLVKEHDVVVWNRTSERTERVVAAGASVASSVAAAVAGRPVVVTSLFGPDTVREVITSPDALGADVLWIDSTTVSPEDADEFAAWAEARGVRYVHTPVVGTIGPARNGALGVYVGGTDAAARAEAEDIVRPWADPVRLKQVDSAAKAAGAKLLANLALAVSLQGLAEALRLGKAEGFTAEEVLDLLEYTGLAFPAKMKRAQVLSGEFDDAHFTADALAKDIRLMLRSTPDPLPATTAALEALTREQRAGRGASDISVLLAPER
ncbi:NAD(P)-dependent oxidoreductase [Propioniciclava tarda]|uniref:NAD(P)-dependent oxidoreductase n=1 Tax=Propioniciclava tarda TaxID=433330 RepID=A0A4Q9KP23_PROTD|nr:NAD(P)-binding domain-containing protein [Propioniciclava tarda]TBT96366.1 NAD(P)-dependent oxidoreductase [Propioniciclava tarda]SMO36537.1 3-hydroxyisobutyrate dehydrogenase [Propioniciclava tarda]HQA30662.1 NAD(P)-binding domain-containing protein [Propioniciclava tarda]